MDKIFHSNQTQPLIVFHSYISSKKIILLFFFQVFLLELIPLSKNVKKFVLQKVIIGRKLIKFERASIESPPEVSMYVLQYPFLAAELTYLQPFLLRQHIELYHHYFATSVVTTDAFLCQWC